MDLCSGSIQMYQLVVSGCEANKRLTFGFRPFDTDVMIMSVMMLSRDIFLFLASLWIVLDLVVELMSMKYKQSRSKKKKKKKKKGKK